MVVMELVSGEWFSQVKYKSYMMCGIIRATLSIALKILCHSIDLQPLITNMLFLFDGRAFRGALKCGNFAKKVNIPSTNRNEQKTKN